MRITPVASLLCLAACASPRVETPELARETPASGFVDGSLGARLYYEVHGNPDGRDVLLIGVSPSLEAHALARAAYLERLGPKYRVLLIDHPGGAGASHAPSETGLTAEHVVTDLLRLADAAGMREFAVVGYSWGGNAALQLAIHSARVNALVVGGWPALGGPYALMGEICARIQEASAGMEPDEGMTMDPGEYWSQFVSYYASLEHWDERAGVASLTCPRLNFVDEEDEFVFMGLASDLAGAVRAHETELRDLGWEVEYVASGAGHMGGFKEDVAGGLIASFLDRHLLAR